MQFSHSLSMTSAAASISRSHSTSNSTAQQQLISSASNPQLRNQATRQISTSNSKNKQFGGGGDRRGFHTISKTFADQAQCNQTAATSGSTVQ
jgi:hypothetical protein